MTNVIGSLEYENKDKEGIEQGSSKSSIDIWKIVVVGNEISIRMLQAREHAFLNYRTRGLEKLNCLQPQQVLRGWIAID